MKRYTQILYQLVFSTKNREMTLLKDNRPVFYNYIWGILKEKNCFLYRIGGIEDHTHIIFSLHPCIALADLVKDIKLATSDFIKRNNLFPTFAGWQKGYGAFTYTMEAKDALVVYVKNQEEHHKTVSSKQEMMDLLRDFGIEFEESDLD
jgi:putative transposase